MTSPDLGEQIGSGKGSTAETGVEDGRDEDLGPAAERREPATDDAAKGRPGGGERARTAYQEPAGGSSTAAMFSEGLAEGYRAMLRMLEPLLAGVVTPASTPAGRQGAGAEDSVSQPFGRLQDWMGAPFPWSATPLDMGGFSKWWLGGLQTDYRDALQSWTAPWLEALQPADERVSRDGERSALSEFADLYWDAYERTMGRLLESPSVGYRREFDEELLQTFRASLEFRRASFDYQVVLADAWVKAIAEMMSELESMAGQGKTVNSVVELLRLWTKVADRVLIETFGQEEYAKVQGRLLNASMAYRLEERRTAEAFLKMTPIPSRSDLDEVSRELHQLRRRVRELERRLREAEPGSTKKSPRTKSGTGKKPSSGVST